MVGMMNIACRTPYPVDEPRPIWSTDLAGRRIDPVTLAYVLSYALATSAMVKETLRDLALDAGLEAGEIDMDLITQPLILEALAEGEARGKTEGKASTPMRLPGRRFGPLPASTRIQVDAASERELDDWIDAILDAPTLAAVFRNGNSL